MNILYLSCHSVLEYEELSIFNELGHNFFVLHGSYQNPQKPVDPKRPAIDAPFNQHLNDLAMQCSQDKIHDDMLEWADVIITMHRLDWLKSNWSKIREKKVVPVWRTIGQSIFKWEEMAAFLRSEGLKIVRYSPNEAYIPGYAGEDALIRFGVEKYRPWTGGDNRVHVFGQGVKKRGDFLAYSIVEQVTRGLPRIAYGPKNEDIEWSGGLLEYEDLLQKYRTADVMFYTGSVPASYTLSFIEALMTGTPMVCIGSDLYNIEKHFPGHRGLYEIPDIIKDGVNGFVANNTGDLKVRVQQLLGSQSLRMKISDAARSTAIDLFSKEKTKQGWDQFLKTL